MQENYGQNQGPDSENLLPDGTDNGNGGNNGGATGNVQNAQGFWNVDLDNENPGSGQAPTRDRGKISIQLFTFF